MKHPDVKSELGLTFDPTPCRRDADLRQLRSLLQSVMQPRYERGLKKLHGLLKELLECSADQHVSIYASYSEYGLRIDEISMTGLTKQGGIRGESWQRSVPECLGLLAAAEDVVTTVDIPSVRPDDWEVDYDPHAEAIWQLKELWK